MNNINEQDIGKMKDDMYKLYRKIVLLKQDIDYLEKERRRTKEIAYWALGIGALPTITIVATIIASIVKGIIIA